MSSGVWVGLVAPLLFAPVKWTGELKASVQGISGRSNSPFITGPDSPPLANAAVDAQTRAVTNLIVSPSGQLRLRAIDRDVLITYAPRLFFDAQDLAAPPTAFHLLSSKIRLGRPAAWLLTLAPSLTLGGLDLGGGTGADAGTLYDGSSRPNALGGIPSSYASFSLLGRLGHPAPGGWTVGTGLLVSQMGRASRPPTPLEAEGIGLPGLGLRNLRRLESISDAAFVSRTRRRWKLELRLGYLDFPSTQSYLTAQPSAMLDQQIFAYTELHLRLGAMRYLTGELPNFFDKVGTLVVAEAGLQQRFTQLGLPQLKGGLALNVGPYVDLIWGMLEPRTSMTAQAAYALGRRLNATLQLRYYTERYAGHTINLSHDKDVMISNLSLRGRLTAHLNARVGAYSIIRHRNPSATDRIRTSYEYFLFVGADGTLDL